ncbi:hypothetical protein L7F22_053562 [Adiantum nelumboides]|nr:hypothetical protein [Adiantum nelumboides]
MAAKITKNLSKKKPKIPECSEARIVQRISVPVAKALVLETQTVGTSSIPVDSSEDNSDFEKEQDEIEVQMCQRIQQLTIELEDIRKSLLAVARFIQQKKQAEAMTVEVPQIKDDEPSGLLENLLIKVGFEKFKTNFLILDVQGAYGMLLGRPWLRSDKAVQDYANQAPSPTVEVDTKNIKDEIDTIQEEQAQETVKVTDTAQDLQGEQVKSPEKEVAVASEVEKEKSPLKDAVEEREIEDVQLTPAAITGQVPAQQPQDTSSELFDDVNDYAQQMMALTKKMRLAAIERATRAQDLDQVVDALQGELKDCLNAIEDLQAQVKSLKEEAATHQQIKEKLAKEIIEIAALLKEMTEASLASQCNDARAKQPLGMQTEKQLDLKVEQLKRAWRHKELIEQSIMSKYLLQTLQDISTPQGNITLKIVDAQQWINRVSTDLEDKAKTFTQALVNEAVVSYLGDLDNKSNEDKDEEDNEDPAGTSRHQGLDDDDNNDADLLGTSPSRGASTDPPPPSTSHTDPPASTEIDVDHPRDTGALGG